MSSDFTARGLRTCPPPRLDRPRPCAAASGACGVSAACAADVGTLLAVLRCVRTNAVNFAARLNTLLCGGLDAVTQRCACLRSGSESARRKMRTVTKLSAVASRTTLSAKVLSETACLARRGQRDEVDEVACRAIERFHSSFLSRGIGAPPGSSGLST